MVTFYSASQLVIIITFGILCGNLVTSIFNGIILAIFGYNDDDNYSDGGAI